MAVGFKDKLQFFHILKDGLRPYKEQNQYKNCCYLKFSDGGQYLAVAFIKKQATMGMDKYQIGILDSFSTASMYPTIDSHQDYIVDMFW